MQVLGTLQVHGHDGEESNLVCTRCHHSRQTGVSSSPSALVGSHPGKSLLKVAAVHLFFASLRSKLASLSPRFAPQRALCNWANRFGSKAWHRSHIIHIVSKILRWVLSRA